MSTAREDEVEMSVKELFTTEDSNVRKACELKYSFHLNFRVASIEADEISMGHYRGTGLSAALRHLPRSVEFLFTN